MSEKAQDAAQKQIERMTQLCQQAFESGYLMGAQAAFEVGKSRLVLGFNWNAWGRAARKAMVLWSVTMADQNGLPVDPRLRAQAEKHAGLLKGLHEVGRIIR